MQLRPSCSKVPFASFAYEKAKIIFPFNRFLYLHLQLQHRRCNFLPPLPHPPRTLASSSSPYSVSAACPCSRNKEGKRLKNERAASLDGGTSFSATAATGDGEGEDEDECVGRGLKCHMSAAASTNGLLPDQRGREEVRIKGDLVEMMVLFSEITRDQNLLYTSTFRNFISAT